MSDKAEIIAEKSFPSDLSLLPKIQDYVQQQIKKYLPHDKIDAVTLAVSEAVSNGIKHGNKSDASKKITLRIKLTDEKIIIESMDEGEGFELEKIPDPTNPENLLKESGRGIFIIQNVIDKLSYEFTENGTLTVLEIKR